MGPVVNTISEKIQVFLRPRHEIGKRRARTAFSKRSANMTEIYVSTDVESDGPIPGPHSMLSFASAAYRADKTLLGTFEANLTLLPGAQGDPKTIEWWRGQPDAW